jgi:adenosylcobyric acid synthase
MTVPTPWPAARGVRPDSAVTTEQLRPLMVLGCTSNAGKSLLVTALCRWFARRGVDVAPFKAQNMSNNARVVTGGEIGVAQWLQALAAGVEPDVRMNPVLLKPEADTRSQVVVEGVVRHDLTEMPWRERGPSLWPAMTGALDSLRRDHELVIIEGAGSPAEINLPDLVNNRILAHADAAALLACDIDRGGAFAHLYGTWALVPDATRERLVGFVLNKFRGDAGLLEPGPTRLRELTGMAHAGTMPMLRHELPDEEGATIRTHPRGDAPHVAVVRYPYGSNLDELHQMGHVAHVRLATRPADLAGADLVLLPGSKHVAADLDWLRRTGLAASIRAAAASDRRVLGLCGGAMLLGRRIVDPDGVEGAADGLGLLPFDTDMHPTKLTQRTAVHFRDLPAPWAALEGLEIEGYEIRNGRLRRDDDTSADATTTLVARGSVLATTVHGVLEHAAVLDALFDARPTVTLDDTFNQLADAVDRHLDAAMLLRLVARS